MLNFLLVLACALTGCMTTKKNSTKDPGANPIEEQDLNSINDEIENALSPNQISSMWSPEARRANAMFQFLIAQKEELEGRYPVAEAYYESSYNLDPNSLTGSRLARAKILKNPQNLEGVAEARRMALLYPRDAQIRLLYAQALVAVQNLADAEIQLKKSIELDPKSEEAYVTLIKCYQVMGRSKLAIETAHRFVKVLPASSGGWSLLSRLLLIDKKYSEALAPAKRAWELQENNPELTLIYGLTLDLNKRGKEAVKLYEQLYRFNPGNPELVQRMVSLYNDLGNLEDALTLLDDMIENSSDQSPGLKMQKIIVLWELNRNAEALKILEDLSSKIPESDRISFMLGLGYIKVGRLNEAGAKFYSIQEESPLKPEATKQQALTLKLSGKLQEAVSLLENFSESEKADASVFLLLAEFQSETEDPKKSIVIIDKGLTKFPKETKLLFAKGAYLERFGDRKSSADIMRQLIKENPNDAAALNFLGYMLAEEGTNLEEAEALVRKALVIQPNNGGYLDSLGWILYQKKKYSEALTMLLKAAELDPKEGVIYEHIADAYAALDQTGKSLEYFKMALEQKNEKRDQQRILKKFESLKKSMKVQTRS